MRGARAIGTAALGLAAMGTMCGCGNTPAHTAEQHSSVVGTQQSATAGTTAYPVGSTPAVASSPAAAHPALNTRQFSVPTAHPVVSHVPGVPKVAPRPVTVAAPAPGHPIAPITSTITSMPGAPPSFGTGSTPVSGIPLPKNTNPAAPTQGLRSGVPR
jgi:hypothetical protein